MSEENSTRETVGKIALDLQQQKPDTLDPIEIEREAHKDYANNIYLCLEDGKKVHCQSDFYIVVETKKERLLDNVIRNYFFHRKSCPTPNYDQTTYKYNWKLDQIFFLWVVPSKDTCEIFKNNALKIVPEEKELLGFVLDFEDGTLLKLAKRLNNEKVDSILLH